MGKIVGGFANSHVLFPPDGVEAQAERVIEGLLDLRRRVRALKPDLIVLAGNDHFNNFDLARQVTLGIGVADQFTTFGDGGAPTFTFQGDRNSAESFARFAARRDFELVQVEEVRPDHGIAIPKLIIDPRCEIPTVPLYINATMPVPASPRRCYRLGQVLHAFIEEATPPQKRVVVGGVGGLSHWLCVPEQGRVAEQFDRNFLSLLVAGRGEEMAEISTEQLCSEAGNGGLELTSWLFMAGALGPAVEGDILFYEPIEKWITGMGAVALIPAGGPR